MTRKILKKTTTSPKKKVMTKKAVKITKGATKKKDPVKKIARKIAIKRVVEDKKDLVVAKDENAFYAVNGAVVHSLLDLHDELETMLEEEFSYHFGPDDNHFSMWMREILFDEDCAEDFKKANTRRKARTVLKKHLKKYSY